MGVTVYDIARAAGVGRSTVCRALTGIGYVSPETRARVLKVAKELKYRPNHIASSLAGGRSRFVGVVAGPSIGLTFDSTIVPIQASLRDVGYSMLFYASSDSVDLERGLLDELMQDRVAGVIAVPSSATANPRTYQDLVEADVSLVILNRQVEGLSVPQVVCDDYNTARLAAEHLISLGHRDIVCLSVPQQYRAGRVRVRGFRDAMDEAGIALDDTAIVETGFSYKSGAEAMAKVIERKRRPTAVIARHDIVAMGAIDAILAAGLSVPDDISIVGNADIWCGALTRVPLTTINHPLEEMGRLGVDKLLAMLAGESVEPTTVVLPAELVVRSSTAARRC